MTTDGHHPLIQPETQDPNIFPPGDVSGEPPTPWAEPPSSEQLSGASFEQRDVTTYIGMRHIIGCTVKNIWGWCNAYLVLHH